MGAAVVGSYCPQSPASSSAHQQIADSSDPDSHCCSSLAGGTEIGIVWKLKGIENQFAVLVALFQTELIRRSTYWENFDNFENCWHGSSAGRENVESCGSEIDKRRCFGLATVGLKHRAQ